ncbi:hypothetical protein TBLA_0A05800 [Henningerozyma blattae CBS 6284]|uniref:Mitochondrial dicarboxylate transporter n=1 Tax=Henningerozyma blattae (strain ATCC 34711 / CBS 6284 / DSM 70876 / NBRC 10599 / NRRL Y-10934 / UCD 77-7) TaxID=1071380 RepID=I2GW71_HENB6|nr:hypothetical protein TBLA_0A05800 [Tetrapisispora blattae CBS 6284]CCH58373.1 hypothetical protein TBLA_0A05800 [Tetrapisispora blattae CBS 6284]
MDSKAQQQQHAPQQAIKYPWWYGGVGGMVACVTTHPLDLAKVRLQTSHIHPRPNLISMIGKIVAHDGFLTLYNGLSAAMLRQCTYTTSRFGCYAIIKENLIPSKHQTNTSYLLPASMVSGAIGGLVGNPSDIVNIRMQNDRTLPQELRRGYKNCFEGLFRIVRDEGMKALFIGWKPNLIRGVLMTSSQVVTYDVFKNYLVSGPAKLNPKKKTTHFTASLLAGLVATTICSPADVMKTRIMNAHKSEGAEKSATRILLDAIKKEGPTFMFRGWLPSFVRLGPFTIIIFLTVEQLKKYRVGMSDKV